MQPGMSTKTGASITGPIAASYSMAEIIDDMSVLMSVLHLRDLQVVPSSLLLLYVLVELMLL